MILRERKGDLGPAVLVVTMRTSVESGGPLLGSYIGAVRVAEDDDKEGEEPEEGGVSGDQKPAQGGG